MYNINDFESALRFIVDNEIDVDELIIDFLYHIACKLCESVIRDDLDLDESRQALTAFLTVYMLIAMQCGIVMAASKQSVLNIMLGWSRDGKRQ